MNGSQLMGLDNMGTRIYAVHGYFRRLIVSQQTLGFLGVTNAILDDYIVFLQEHEENDGKMEDDPIIFHQAM